MKQQFRALAPFPTPRLENARIYIATIAGAVAILLMILAEMKFFGT